MIALVLLLAACNTAPQPDAPESGAGVKNLVIGEDVEYGKEDYQKIVDGNNKLGMDLVANVPANDHGNFFVSPLSLYMALAMVYNGSDGVTKDEIVNVLEAKGISRDEMNQANASLISKLSSDSDEIELNIANSIWVKDSYEFLEDYTESSQDYYNAKIEAIDITDPASADLINDWVSDATNGKIEEMTAKPLPGNLVALLLNAIYFNGN